MLVDNKQTSRKDRECKSTGAFYIVHEISTEETARDFESSFSLGQVLFGRLWVLVE